MFSTKEEIQRTVDAMVDHVKSLDRGDVVKFGDLETITGTERYAGRWVLYVQKMRRRILKERGIAMRPLVNVGYKLCTKDEQLKYCARNRQRRAVRQLNRGIAEVDHLPHDGLSLHQQRLRALTLDNLRHERRAVRRCMREQGAEIKRTETLPRRKPSPATAE